MNLQPDYVIENKYCLISKKDTNKPGERILGAVSGRFCPPCVEPSPSAAQLRQTPLDTKTLLRTDAQNFEMATFCKKLRKKSNFDVFYSLSLKEKQIDSVVILANYCPPKRTKNKS